MKNMLVGLFALIAANLFAEITIIDGVKYECVDGVCRMVEENTPSDPSLDEFLGSFTPPGETSSDSVMEVKSWQRDTDNIRQAEGYMNADEFVEFIDGKRSANFLEGKAIWLVILLALFGGLAMNLTPCVLPMIPINLMVIGKSAARGAWYGLGIALAYGVMGVIAALGGSAFGSVQANPYFNTIIALLFIVLGFALSGVFMIDLSKKRVGLASKRQSMLPWAFAFMMGIVSAVLAGACVAPILIAVLLLTAKLYAAGSFAALMLPFVLGLGMALPWPLLGAGLQVLPKPGTWMKYVNRGFAAFVFILALYYGGLAVQGFSGRASQVKSDGIDVSALEASLESVKRPILIDCWATWCKNCSAMELTTFKDPKVVKALEGYTVLRVQCEDLLKLKAIAGFEKVTGLPSFTIIEETK